MAWLGFPPRFQSTTTQASFLSRGASNLNIELTFRRIIIFYPVSAILNLSCNIIQKPASRAAHSDLNILIAVCKTIQLLEKGGNGLSETQLESLEAIHQMVQKLIEQASSLVFECRIDTTRHLEKASRQ